MPTPRAPVSGPEPVVEVRRSRRRRSTVAAYREDDRVVVMIPARMSRAEEQEWVATMLARLERSERRRRPSDAALMRRAKDLNARYLDGKATPGTVRWVDNQNSRWGSCTPDDRAIRLSRRLEGMPAWVIDYVLVHELAHLLELGHTARFWSLVDRYPKAERAKGFLEGVAAASHLGITADEPDCSEAGAAAMAADDVG
jgi:predicted metal-dependent hydrolase